MIKVYTVDMGRTYFYHQWIDPQTGQRITRSSKLKQRRLAERAAGELENKLNRLQSMADGSMPWTDFRFHLMEQKLKGMARKSELQIDAILNQVEESIKPKRIIDLTAFALSEHAAWLRQKGRAEDTIKSHMRHLKVVLRWAHEQNLIPAVPTIPRVARAKKGGSLAKGRPLSPDEVEAFAAAAAKSPRSRHAPESWADLIRGLDVSGLRLGEAMVLTWDDPNMISIDVSSPNRPKLRIPEQHEKAHKGRLHPITPDFAEFLLRRKDRTGHVFNAIHSKGQPTRSTHVASHILSDIGAASGVKVDATRHCTAHDLRRSFGFRWAMLVMPAVLKELMRHETIQTTMHYYVGQEANRLQDEAYAAWDRQHGLNSSANTQKGGSAEHRKS